MLTYHQCETVAFVTDGGIICRECAERQYTSVGCDKIDAGIGDFPDVSAVSRFEIEEVIGADASDTADEAVSDWRERFPRCEDREILDRVWQRVYDRAPDWHPCSRCDGEIQ